MKLPHSLLFIASLCFLLNAPHASIAYAASGQPGYNGGQTITCSSNDGKRNYCNIPPRSNVNLTRQISGSACIQNQTWGVDQRGLWVDRGCRAQFTVGGGGGGWNNGPGGGNQGQIVTCSSNDGKRNYCNSYGAGPRDITLGRQISGSACVQGQTWGVDQRGLWVDRGCRADFFIRGGNGNNGPGQNWGNQGQTVTCSSNDGKRNYCNIPPRANVNLSRQISGSACVQGQTWGTDQRGLWVDRGCRAEFYVR
jgi:hypothetical protein